MDEENLKNILDGIEEKDRITGDYIQEYYNK